MNTDECWFKSWVAKSGWLGGNVCYDGNTVSLFLFFLHHFNHVVQVDVNVSMLIIIND